MASKSNINVLIGCTGSVASICVPKLAEDFMSLGYSVVIVPTTNASHFLKCEALVNSNTPGSKCYEESCLSCHEYFLPENKANIQSKQICLLCELKALYPNLTFLTDVQEWQSWKKRGDPVKHIELRNWADILVLAPLDANTLAKIAQGLCDNLLTCIVRAWNMKKPVVFCPAMNTQMYLHPFTSQHINILKGLGFQEVEATTKRLMCGELGIGAMAAVPDIVERVKKLVSS